MSEAAHDLTDGGVVAELATTRGGGIESARCDNQVSSVCDTGASKHTSFTYWRRRPRSGRLHDSAGSKRIARRKRARTGQQIIFRKEPDRITRSVLRSRHGRVALRSRINRSALTVREDSGRRSVVDRRIQHRFRLSCLVLPPRRGQSCGSGQCLGSLP